MPCPCTIPQRGGYRPTRRNRQILRKYKAGKSIGFTMKSSLKECSHVQMDVIYSALNIQRPGSHKFLQDVSLVLESSSRFHMFYKHVLDI